MTVQRFSFSNPFRKKSSSSTPGDLTNVTGVDAAGAATRLKKTFDKGAAIGDVDSFMQIQPGMSLSVEHTRSFLLTPFVFNGKKEARIQVLVPGDAKRGHFEAQRLLTADAPSPADRLPDELASWGKGTILSFSVKAGESRVKQLFHPLATGESPALPGSSAQTLVQKLTVPVRAMNGGYTAAALSEGATVCDVRTPEGRMALKRCGPGTLAEIRRGDSSSEIVRVLGETSKGKLAVFVPEQRELGKPWRAPEALKDGAFRDGARTLASAAESSILKTKLALTDALLEPERSIGVAERADRDASSMLHGSGDSASLMRLGRICVFDFPPELRSERDEKRGPHAARSESGTEREETSDEPPPLRSAYSDSSADAPGSDATGLRERDGVETPAVASEDGRLPDAGAGQRIEPTPGGTGRSALRKSGAPGKSRRVTFGFTHTQDAQPTATKPINGYKASTESTAQPLDAADWHECGELRLVNVGTADRPVTARFLKAGKLVIDNVTETMVSVFIPAFRGDDRQQALDAEMEQHGFVPLPYEMTLSEAAEYHDLSLTAIRAQLEKPGPDERPLNVEVARKQRLAAQAEGIEISQDFARVAGERAGYVYTASVASTSRATDT